MCCIFVRNVLNFCTESVESAEIIFFFPEVLKLCKNSAESLKCSHYVGNVFKHVLHFCENGAELM